MPAIPFILVLLHGFMFLFIAFSPPPIHCRLLRNLLLPSIEEEWCWQKLSNIPSLFLVIIISCFGERERERQRVSRHTANTINRLLEIAVLLLFLSFISEVFFISGDVKLFFLFLYHFVYFPIMQILSCFFFFSVFSFATIFCELVCFSFHKLESFIFHLKQIGWYCFFSSSIFVLFFFCSFDTKITKYHCRTMIFVELKIKNDFPKKTCFLQLISKYIKCFLLEKCGYFP